jgi:mannose-1-phosphate guanylyltransferase
VLKGIEISFCPLVCKEGCQSSVCLKSGVFFSGIVVVAPSDHWIEDEVQFVANLERSFQYCEHKDSLMTIGILPTFPNTGYGYIEYDKLDVRPIKQVVQFREKPDYATARKFIQSRNFLWNAGIFVWNVNAVLKAYEMYNPAMYQLFDSGYHFYNTPDERNFISTQYPKAENISVDYAILEKADNVFVLPATFDWNDLGTWGSLHEKLEKDANNNAVINATVVLENASDNIIRTSGKKLVVIDGVSNFIIVDKDDVLLIYPKEKEQDIKKIVEKINK